MSIATRTDADLYDKKNDEGYSGEKPGAEWVNVGGSPMQVDDDGEIVKGCPGLQGAELENLAETANQRADIQKAAEEAGWEPRRVKRARATHAAAKKDAPDAVVLVRHGDKFHAFGDDAAKLHEVSQVGDGQSAEIDADTLDHHVSSLVAAGHRVGVVDRTREGHPDWDSEADPEVKDTVADERGVEPQPVDPTKPIDEAENWNAVIRDPSSATPEQLQSALQHADHLEQQHASNPDLTDEQRTAIASMLSGIRGRIQQALGGRTVEPQSVTEEEPVAPRSDVTPTTPERTTDTRHLSAGEQIQNTPGKVRDLLQSLHRLRDTRRQGHVQTKELGADYAKEMYDHLRSIQRTGDDFGDVHDMADELGHGAIGYSSPAGNLVMIPPKFQNDPWDVRYTLPHESQQLAEPQQATEQQSTLPEPAVEPQQPETPLPKPKRGRPKKAQESQPLEPTSDLNRTIIELAGDDPKMQRDLKNAIEQTHKQMNEDTLTRNQAYRELMANFGMTGGRSQQDEKWRQMAPGEWQALANVDTPTLGSLQEAKEVLNKVRKRDKTFQYQVAKQGDGYVLQKRPQAQRGREPEFLKAIRDYQAKGRDYSSFITQHPLGKKFDQMAEYAANYYPELISKYGGEPEHGLWMWLAHEGGMQQLKPKSDEDVIAAAIQRLQQGAIESPATEQDRQQWQQEHERLLAEDPDYRRQREELDTLASQFSRSGMKIRYDRVRKWLSKSSQRWRKYAKQLSFAWGAEQEQQHPRAQTEQTGYRPGEFVPKGLSQAPAAEPAAPAAAPAAEPVKPLAEVTPPVAAPAESDKPVWEAPEETPQPGQPREETNEDIVAKIKSGDRNSASELLRRNQGTIMAAARQHGRNPSHIEDLAQEASIIMLEAVHDYDPSRGMKFNTYVNMLFNRDLPRLSTKLKGPFPKKKIRTIEGEQVESQYPQVVPASQLKDVEGESQRIEELAPDTGDASVSDTLETSESKSGLEEALTDIPEREANVVRMRFGLGGHEPHGWKEIGDKLGISHTRAQQLVASAFNRLRDMMDPEDYAKDKPEADPFDAIIARAMAVVFGRDDKGGWQAKVDSNRGGTFVRGPHGWQAAFDAPTR